MTYEIVTPKSVQKQIMALSAEMILRIDEAILDLAENPRPDGVTKNDPVHYANPIVRNL